MLGLGLKNSGMYSNRPTVTIDTLGNFTLSTTLNLDASFFKIMAKKVEHDNDPADNDNDPKVILSNLVVKINDVVNSEYDLDSSHLGNSNSFTHVTYISSSSLSFEDATLGSFFADVELYNDNATNFSAVATDKVEVSGNIKLADGTAYVPESGAEQGRIEFTFNNHTGTAGNKLQVFIDPNYNSGAVGTTDEHITVDS